MPATMTRARRPLRRPAPNDFADALRAVKGASAMLRRACKREDAAIELMRYCRSVKPDASRDEIGQLAAQLAGQIGIFNSITGELLAHNQ